MWQIQKIESHSNSFRFEILEENSEISYDTFINRLITSENFRKFYNRVLKRSNFEAFFWENIPVTKNTLYNTYECAIINSTFLARQSADSDTFSSYFSNRELVVSFPNLGGDAQLIAPCPDRSHSTYTHIGNFVREAPEDQIMEFWKLVGKEMKQHITDEPKWLSTSGLGVFWLHARIDSTPKYYQTEAYKTLE